jgi:hypothetical protein
MANAAERVAGSFGRLIHAVMQFQATALDPRGEPEPNVFNAHAVAVVEAARALSAEVPDTPSAAPTDREVALAVILGQVRAVIDAW